MSVMEPRVDGALAPVQPEDRLAAIEARLEHVTALLEEQEQRYRDLQEVVSDVMPALNGMLRIASAKLEALEKSGALQLLPVAHRGLQEMRHPERLDPVRPLALLGALRDPNVGRGVALLLELLRAAGSAVRGIRETNGDGVAAVARQEER